ncbi:MAG: translation elongation factor Ts [Actinomycetaceae bacterium]|nr:translation elongation factor Ts [Actinomycetaceae bacterium]
MAKNYTTADIKALREQTGAGMLDVKKALDEAKGDHAEAIKIIRLKGIKSLSKREDRSASAGLVVAEVSEDGKVGVMVEVNSETDFVAKNQKFIDFADEVLKAAVESGANTVAELLAAPLGEGTVKDRVDDMGAVIGEKIEIGRMTRLEADKVTKYMHLSNPDLPPQVGVLVGTDTAGQEAAHEIAMHIAAYKPSYLSSADVPEDELARERDTLTALTLKEGKPEHIVERIVEGRMRAYFKDNCLLDQDFARDPKFTVGQIVEKTGGKVTGFARFQVGA